MQATILDAYRRSLASQGFTEFEAPALVGVTLKAVQRRFASNTLMIRCISCYEPTVLQTNNVGAFERAFTVAKIFRAEKSATTRHLSEATCLDFEMGFVRMNVPQ